ncbi:MAG: right-handed parallel beta-helix repeat-containing protein [Pirellulaceae bacterium]
MSLVSICRLLVGCALTVGCFISPGTASDMFYVSPTGNDAWTGRLQEPNPERTDGPLASLIGARDAVRALRAQAGAPTPVTVRVLGGVYHMAEPLVLSPEDSGSESAPVVFEVVPEQRAVLSGGQVITGMEQKGPLWEVTIPEVSSGQWYFRQLFVAGQRRQVARSPNTGYHRIAERLPGPADAQGKPFSRDTFLFAEGDLAPFERIGDVNVILMHSWETSIHPLKSVDVGTRTVQFAAPLKEWWCIGYWEPHQRYYVENARELLDQPGEWYLNRETGVLSYWPLPGETLGNTQVVAPRVTELVRLEGQPDEGRFVDHITLRGLTFHNSDWVHDPRGNSSTQAAVEVPAALMADGARHCTIEDCEVAHVGTYGIWLRRGCTDCQVRRNRLFDLGAGGIRVGEAKMASTDAAESSRNVVDNNHIYDGGHVYAAGVGVWVAQSSHNRISNNDIHDLDYTGISIGWNWDDAPNRTDHNVIERNHVHHVARGVLSDAGLIYCLGVSPGSVIRDNLFHDIWPYAQPPFGWGIYLDATCGEYLVENNLVYNTLSGGLMYNNGGHEHVIQNNIFATSANHALWPYMEKRPSTFRRNIIYLTQGDLFIPMGERSLDERLAAGQPLGEWNKNLYWHTQGQDQLRFYRRDFAEWQALGLDTDSLIADPKFVDPAQRDFQLTAESPAFGLGFQPLNIREVGLYGDPQWVTEANHVRCAVTPLPPAPPPPAPLTLNDGFEDTAVGTSPAQANVSGEEQGASILVSDEQAATGRHSLKITDSVSLEPRWQPHFFYEPHISSGTVRQSFDMWIEPGVEFFTEWRDNSIYPRNTGPSMRIDAAGKIFVGGAQLTTVPPRQWVHVCIEGPVGKTAPHRFQLTLTTRGVEPLVVRDLPYAGDAFRELHWLGFSSTAAADTAFYLDNITIVTVPDVQ